FASPIASSYSASVAWPAIGSPSPFKADPASFLRFLTWSEAAAAAIISLDCASRVDPPFQAHHLMVNLEGFLKTLHVSLFFSFSSQVTNSICSPKATAKARMPVVSPLTFKKLGG